MGSEIINSSISLLRPRLTDGILLALLLALTIFSPKLIPARIAGDTLVIKTSDSVYEISFKDEGSHVIDGHAGQATLVVKNGEAFLRNAPCPLKICEAMGPVSRSGEVILCLPNRIYIRVTGEEEVDAISR
jgi:hypothetical protein